MNLYEKLRVIVEDRWDPATNEDAHHDAMLVLNALWPTIAAAEDEHGRLVAAVEDLAERARRGAP